MPAVRAVLSFSPKVRMANSFSHSGVNWMKVWPSEFSGDAGVLKIPIHSPKAASSSAIPIARPIATTPTSPAAATPGRQGCAPGACVGVGRGVGPLAGGHALDSGSTGVRMGRSGRNVFGASLRWLGHLSIVRRAAATVLPSSPFCKECVAIGHGSVRHHGLRHHRANLPFVVRNIGPSDVPAAANYRRCTPARRPVPLGRKDEPMPPPESSGPVQPQSGAARRSLSAVPDPPPDPTRGTDEQARKNCCG